jgi:hypothetical protein
MQSPANDAFYALRPAVVEAARTAAGAARPLAAALDVGPPLLHVHEVVLDGDVHKYFSPYASPHDAFIAFMNVLDDLARRAERGAN